MCCWIETPWDRRAFGFDTYEIKDINQKAFEKIEHIPGHFTVRAEPLQPKKLLHDFHFYYCDTLIEPFCLKESFTPVFREDIFVKRDLHLELAMAMSQNVFQYDRFHRDFHISQEDADRRYILWIQDIAASGTLYGLWHQESLAGFFACQDERILLHALKSSFRGKGLAKYFWSGACQALFDEGCKEISSSISATNMPVLNLYRSLGFAFRNPVEIYHKYNPPKL